MKGIALMLGIAFGFTLAWARVTDPMVIRKMLLLREPDVFLLMGSAIAVAAVGARLLRARGMRSFINRETITWSPTAPAARHVIGSAIFGAGWSVAATCPGPVAAMIGQGRFGGLFVAGGLMLGISLYRLTVGRAKRSVVAPTSAAACL